VLGTSSKKRRRRSVERRERWRMRGKAVREMAFYG